MTEELVQLAYVEATMNKQGWKVTLRQPMRQLGRDWWHYCIDGRFEFTISEIAMKRALPAAMDNIVKQIRHRMDND